jgi:DNA-binding LacI/PurR family transcriptional regulator
LISGVEEVVSQKGYALLVATIRPSLRKNALLPTESDSCDGLLVFADSLNDDQIVRLYQKRFPVVLIHRTAPENAPFPSVTVENKAATRKSIDHLIEAHGRKRIIFMRGPDQQEDSYWREVGYRASLEAHGIPVDETLFLHGQFESEIACEALTHYMNSGQADFDAIFTGDDDAAIGVLSALKNAGKNVPEDVSVVGFDDLRLSLYLNPPLTTVRAPTEEVGRTAAEQLFRLIENQAVEATTLLPTEIIFRRSCGCMHENSHR